MSDRVKAALILAAALIVAAILSGGFYLPAGQAQVLQSLWFFRLNRFTGQVQAVHPDVPAQPAEEPTATPTEGKT